MPNCEPALPAEEKKVEVTNRRDRFKKFRMRHHDAILAFLLLLIPIGWWLVTSGYPLISGLTMGFMDWSNGPAEWAGLDNFILFFRSEYYYMALLNSIWIGGLCLIIQAVLSLLVALLLNKITVLKGFYRAAWYVPVITSSVVVTQIFNIFIDPADGVLNNLLINMGKEPVVWNRSFGWGVFWIVFYSVWKGMGGSVLMWLAALQSVDRSVCEAAEVDGAGRTVVFWRIVFPSMMPIISYIVITGFIGAVQIYEPVMFITKGGPYNQTNVLAYMIMRDTFWDNNFGMAGASSLIMLIITFGFTLVIFRRQMKASKEV